MDAGVFICLFIVCLFVQLDTLKHTNYLLLMKSSIFCISQKSHRYEDRWNVCDRPLEQWNDLPLRLPFSHPLLILSLSSRSFSITSARKLLLHKQEGFLSDLWHLNGVFSCLQQ